MYHLLDSISKGWRFLLGSVLIITFIVAELWLLPAPLPRGNIGPLQITAFFLTESAFLVLTRLVYFSAVGWGRLPVTSPKPPLMTFLLLYFTAPITVRALHPITTAWYRYMKALDQPPWRAIFKLTLVGLVLRFGVTERRAQLDQSLLLFSLVGNVVFYLLLSGIEDLFSAILEPLLHVQMWPSFDKPWLSVSFKDFWSFRWHSPYADTNLIVVRQVLDPYLPKPLPAALVYLYSGLCHVGFVYVATGEVSWYMLGFFALAYLSVLSDPMLARWSESVPTYVRLTTRRFVVLATICLSSQLFWHGLWQHRFLQGLASACGLL